MSKLRECTTDLNYTKRKTLTFLSTPPQKFEYSDSLGSFTFNRGAITVLEKKKKNFNKKTFQNPRCSKNKGKNIYQFSKHFLH